MSSPSFEIAGVVHAIPPPRNDKYASFVLHVEDGKYPQFIPFEHKADAIRVNVGDEVKVTFNARGRKWTDPETGAVKYFDTFAAYKVGVTKEAGATHGAPPPPNGGGWGAGPGDDTDGIPF